MLPERRYTPIDLLPDVAVGIKIPIVRADGRLFEQSYTTADQAISNLKNLILTRRGERLMHPTLGSAIQDSLFEQNTEILATNIRDSIQRAMAFWLPYITLNKLNVQPVVAVGSNKEEHGVTISMVVSINSQAANIPITFLVTPSTVQVL